MKCQCGGLLKSDYSEQYKSLVRAAGPKPNHKKKRLQKKLMKKWIKKARLFQVIVPLSRALRCTDCAKVQSFYQAVARNIFPIEQLPDGAMPLYEKYDS